MNWSTRGLMRRLFPRASFAKDSAWSVIIVIIGFVTMFLLIGVNHALGSFIEEWRFSYSSSHSTLVWVQGLGFGFNFLSMVHAVILRKLPGQIVVGVVATVQTAAYVLSALVADSAEALVLLLGVVPFIFAGPIMLFTMNLIGRATQKYRALAYGVSNCGAPVGMMLLPLLADYIISRYGWNTALLILGLLWSLIILFSLFMIELGEESSFPSLAQALAATSLRSFLINSTFAPIIKTRSSKAKKKWKMRERAKSLPDVKFERRDGYENLGFERRKIETRKLSLPAIHGVFRESIEGGTIARTSISEEDEEEVEIRTDRSDGRSTPVTEEFAEKNSGEDPATKNSSVTFAEENVEVGQGGNLSGPPKDVGMVFLDTLTTLDKYLQQMPTLEASLAFERESFLRTFKRLFKRRLVVVFLLYGFVNNIGMFGMRVFLPALLSESFSSSCPSNQSVSTDNATINLNTEIEHQISLVLSFYGVGGIVGVLVLGPLLSWSPLVSRKLLVFLSDSLLVFVLNLLFIFVVDSFVGVSLLTAFLGFCHQGWYGVIWVVIYELFGADNAADAAANPADPLFVSSAFFFVNSVSALASPAALTALLSAVDDGADCDSDAAPARKMSHVAGVALTAAAAAVGVLFQIIMIMEKGREMKREGKEVKKREEEEEEEGKGGNEN